MVIHWRTPGSVINVEHMFHQCMYFEDVMNLGKSSYLLTTNCVLPKTTQLVVLKYNLKLSVSLCHTITDCFKLQMSSWTYTECINSKTPQQHVSSVKMDNGLPLFFQTVTFIWNHGYDLWCLRFSNVWFMYD